MVPRDHQSSDIAVSKVMTKVDLNVGDHDESSSSFLRDVLATVYDQIPFITILIFVFVLQRETIKTWVLEKISVDPEYRPWDPMVRRRLLLRALANVFCQIWFTMLLIALFMFEKTLNAFILENRSNFDQFLYIWVVLNLYIKDVRLNNFVKYTLTGVSIVFYSCFVVTSFFQLQINYPLLSAVVTTELLLFLLVICLHAKIDNTKWCIISFLGGTGAIIFGITVLILNLEGFFANEIEVFRSYVFPSMILPFFFAYLIKTLHKILGIGWYYRNSKFWFDTSLELYKNVMWIFFLVLNIHAMMLRSEKDV